MRSRQHGMLLVAATSIGLSVLAAVMAFPGGAQAVRETPRLLALDQAQQGFGEVSPGDVRDCCFRLRNATDAPLRIVNVLPQCDCTDCTLSKWELAPDEVTELSATWRIGARRGPARTSVMVIALPSSGGEAQTVQLDITATVTPTFSYAPESLSFDSSKPATAKVLFSPGKEPVRITDCYASKRAFTATILDDRTVEVTFDPEEYYAEARSAELTVVTDNARERKCIIPLVVRSSL